MRIDLTIAGLALGGAFYVAVKHPLAAAVIMGLSIGIGISALSIEPSTTKAAFPR